MSNPINSFGCQLSADKAEEFQAECRNFNVINTNIATDPRVPEVAIFN